MKPTLQLPKDVENRFNTLLRMNFSHGLVGEDTEDGYMAYEVEGCEITGNIDDIKQFLAEELAAAKEEGAREEREKMAGWAKPLMGMILQAVHRSPMKSEADLIEEVYKVWLEEIKK